MRKKDLKRLDGEDLNEDIDLPDSHADKMLMHFYLAMQAYIESEDNKDYEINELGMQKYKDSVKAIKKLAEVSDGVVDLPALEPRQTVGSVNAYFQLLDVYGDNVRLLSEAIKYASCISIDADLDGVVCLSYNIPDVFRKKES